MKKARPEKKAFNNAPKTVIGFRIKSITPRDERGGREIVAEIFYSDGSKETTTANQSKTAPAQVAGR